MAHAILPVVELFHASLIRKPQSIGPQNYCLLKLNTKYNLLSEPENNSVLYRAIKPGRPVLVFFQNSGKITATKLRFPHSLLSHGSLFFSIHEGFPPTFYPEIFRSFPPNALARKGETFSLTTTTKSSEKVARVRGRGEAQGPSQSSPVLEIR